MSQAISDHIRLDERSLALHEVVAKKLSHNPHLLDVAKENLRRWQAATTSSSPALSEWEAILAGPVGTIALILVERSENATRLRQSSPFAGVLTEAERRAIYESYSARTYHPGGQRNRG